MGAEGSQRFLEFLDTLGINEAWISEVKPSGRESWNGHGICTENDRKALAALQDRYNKKSGMTVNYLGHFEGACHFGCNAGTRMIYVDAFGEVSPCVFAPLSFGSVKTRPVAEIWSGMSSMFKPSSSCFVNENYPLFSRHDTGSLPISPEGSEALMRDAVFGEPARFQRILYGRGRKQ
jgi:MoaA/NifB/PqqE/SkfB family radical SAM enzyme